MLKKVCTKCNIEKAGKEFYSAWPYRRGGVTRCKDCYREYNLTEDHAEADRRWRAKNPKWAYERTKEYRLAHPEIQKAHNTVSYAIQTGNLERPTNCMSCGEAGKIEAHHENYDLPLDIVWLCRRCHGLTKRQY